MSEYIHKTVIPIMVQERFAVKPEDEQYEAALQCIYCEYGLKKIAQVLYTNVCSFLASGMSQEGKVITLMGTKSQKQSAIETNTQNFTYYMNAKCIAGYN
jgi:hypothetical protein